MTSDSEDDEGSGEDAGNNGMQRSSKTSHHNQTKSHAGRPRSHSVSRSKRKLTTRSGKTIEPPQRHGHVKALRPVVSTQAVAHTCTPVKNVQVHLTKLTLSPDSKSGRKLSAKKYLDKVRREQHNARVRRSRKVSPAHSPEQVTMAGSGTGPSPRTKTVIEKLVAQRPRRTVTPKNLDYTAGLSWQEEKELKKALYVSLQESRRSSASQSRTDSPLPDSGSEEHRPFGGNGRRGRKPAAALGINPMMPPHTGNSGQSTPDTLREGNGNSMSSVVDSVSSQASSQCKLLKAQVRAQRKFAQGSRPVSPCVTPRKPKSLSTPKKQALPSVMAKTEDFLTFLCLRGSSVLPPSLEFFNYTDSDSHMSFPNTPRHSQDGSQPATPLSGGGGDTPRNGRVGSGTPRGRSPAPQSRASSADRELTALGDELGVSPLVTIATTHPLVVGPSTTTASSSSLRFPHVASSPTNNVCAAATQLPPQPLPRCPSLPGCTEGIADVESSLNEYFPLKINSDWRAICDVDETAVEPSIEKFTLLLPDASIEMCDVETAELRGSRPDSLRMQIDTHTLGGDNCSIDEHDSAAEITTRPDLVDSVLCKTDVSSLQKMAPPVIATIVDNDPVLDSSLETSVVNPNTCETDLPSEFVSDMSDATSGTVPMATCIATCAPLVATYRSDFGMSLALLPSLHLISTTSLLSNVTVVLVGSDDTNVTYAAPALLASQPCDVTQQHTKWPVVSSESDGVTRNVTVSGDTTSRCCHVSLITSVCGRAVTAGQHVDHCVSASVLSTPASIAVTLVVSSPSQAASVSKMVSQKFQSHSHCVRHANDPVKPAGRDVVALPSNPTLSPHVGVVCSMVVPLCTPRPPLTLVARVPGVFLADASGSLTVLPSRVTSLIAPGRALGRGVEQGRRQSVRGKQVAGTCYEPIYRQDENTDTEGGEMSRSSIECLQDCRFHSVDSNIPSTIDETMACLAEEKHDTVAASVHLSSASVVDSCVQRCSVEDTGLDMEYVHTTVGYSAASVSKQSGETAMGSAGICPVCACGVGGLYSTVPFPQTSCVVVSSVHLPRVTSRRNPRSTTHRRGPKNITPCLSNLTCGPSNIILGPSNITGGPCNNIPGPSNITRGPSNIIPGPSNIIPGPSIITCGPSNIISDPISITCGPSNTSTGLSNIIPGPSNITCDHSNIIPGPSDLTFGHTNRVNDCADVPPSTDSCGLTLPEGNDPPGVGMHRCAALASSLCCEGWRWAHDVPLELGHGQQLSLYPLPPVIMAPGVFQLGKPRDDVAVSKARKRFHVTSSLKVSRLKHQVVQHHLSLTKHSTLAHTMAHVRKPATVTSCLGSTSTMPPVVGGDRTQGGGGGGGGDGGVTGTGGLSWHEKLLMRRARNAAASRNRRRLKKLGVLTRSKRRRLETQARTTENEAAAAALQASPSLLVPSAKPQAETADSSVTRRSKGMARRRPGSQRVMADAEVDSEPPYVVVVNMQDPTVSVQAAKSRTLDQRGARRRRHHHSPGGSTTDDRTSDCGKKLLGRKERRGDHSGRGDSHKRETSLVDGSGSSTIATKTRSRTSTPGSEGLSKHHSRDVTSTRDSRAKRRSTASVDREQKTASKKDLRMSRVDDSEPSGSGAAEQPAQGSGRSPPEGSRKRSKGHLPVSSLPKTAVLPRVAFRQPFPASQSPPSIVAAPVYHPDMEQFQEPISYTESVRNDAESYGMCVIVPPEGWQPECHVSEDLRFTTQIQHVHKMQNRWGSNVVHLECIKKHLESQGRKVDQHPLVGGIELDIPTLNKTIIKFGGLQQVIDKCKWPRVADRLHIPKSALERTTRLYDAYCKYLLSYDMLSDEDKARLKQHVLMMAGKKSHTQHQDCFTKGKSRTLGEFFRIARNTAAMWFANEQPTTEQVEAKYWSLVSEASQHVSVQTARVDTSSCGSAFPSRKDSPYYRHGWNFNELQHNSGSLLQYIGQVADVSVPTLHINMLFSTGCLSRDLHLLPYIHYLHSGDDIIWYCVPSSEEDKLRAVVKKLCPALVDTSDPVWLSDDTIMLSPDLLKQHGLSVCRCVQKQGQYAVIFPGAFTAWVSCGYNIAESLRFATPSWIPLGQKAAKMLMESCEPDLFSLDRLLLTLARVHKMPTDLLKHTLPHLRETINNELSLRKQLASAGLKTTERLPDDFSLTSGRQRRSFELTDVDENRCEVCKRTCYLSMVMNETEATVYCLLHALTHIQKKRNLRVCRLLYRFTEEDLSGIIEQARHRLVVGSSPAKNRSTKMKT